MEYLVETKENCLAVVQVLFQLTRDHRQEISMISKTMSALSLFKIILSPVFLFINALAKVSK